jgi:hypothetical protein
VTAFAALFILGASFFSGDYYDARLLWIFLILAAVPSSPPLPPHSVEAGDARLPETRRTT